jgi:hypothetical protein
LNCNKENSNLLHTTPTKLCKGKNVSWVYFQIE